MSASFQPQQIRQQRWQFERLVGLGLSKARWRGVH
ncbi:hypothetical protein LINPERHAP2_LOCUS25291 [Linum perenne]